jgi:hypothetical protein
VKKNNELKKKRTKLVDGFGDIISQLRVNDAQIGICSQKCTVRSGLHFRWRRRTPNEADGAEEHEAELGWHDSKIDDLCGGKHQPCGTAVGLEERQREINNTHQPRMSVGAYFWGQVSENGPTGEQRETHRAQAIGDAGGALTLHEGH